MHRFTALILTLGAVLRCTAAPPVLTEAAAVRDYLDSGATNRRPFRLTGTVISVDHVKSRPRVILSDATARISMYCDLGNNPHLGDRVIAEGEGCTEYLEPWATARKLTQIGQGPLPDPVRCRLEDLNAESHDLCLVSVVGTVIDAFPDEVDPTNIFLLLRDGGTTLPVSLPSGFHAKVESLVNARVRINGRYDRAINGARRFSGPYIKGGGDDTAIEVLEPPPADPFSVPALETRYYLAPRDIVRHGRRAVSGEVLAVWQRNRVLLRTREGFLVTATLAHEVEPPRCGTAVTMVGYPETDLFSICLSRAICRETGSPPTTADISRALALDDLMPMRNGKAWADSSYQGLLVRIIAMVKDLSSANAAHARILVGDETHSLPVDLGLHPEVSDRLSVGSKIEITGRCLLEAEHWQPDNIFPRLTSPIVIIRSPDDIRVIAAPPWWTPARLLGVIAALLAALAAFFVRNRILKRIGKLKIGERTRLAVELHDSLSQNLSAIACQVAATRGTLKTSPAAVAGQLETVEKMLQSSRTELKRCLWDLRSDALGEKTFDKAIRKALGTLVTQADVQFRFNVPRNLFDDTDAHAILSVIRELVANAIVHGQADHIRIAGDFTDGLFAFSVRDDGRGFDPDLAPGLSQGHFGLQGIRERIKKLKGEFSVESAPGGPTRITVRIRHP